MIYLPDVLATISYLRGETSPPQAAAATRTEFIQRTLEEIYEANDWKFAQISATLTLVSGVATLPSNLSLEHALNFQYLSSPGDPTTEVSLNELSVNDRYKAVQGTNQYWIEVNPDGTPVFHTREAIATTKFVGYVVAPTLSATVGTPFPDRMTIALGANRWVTKSQNPEADISQDEDFYQNRLSDNIGAYNRNTKRRGLRTIQEIYGSATGDF